MSQHMKRLNINKKLVQQYKDTGHNASVIEPVRASNGNLALPKYQSP